MEMNEEVVEDVPQEGILKSGCGLEIHTVSENAEEKKKRSAG